jgi:hypothetical protein
MSELDVPYFPEDFVWGVRGHPGRPGREYLGPLQRYLRQGP